MSKHKVLALGLLIFLSACQVSGAATDSSYPPPGTSTVEATQTPTPTTTPVWFLPTATPTPALTLTPFVTPDVRPDIGSLLYTGDFTTGRGWDLFKLQRGSIASGGDALTIAILEPNTFMFSNYKDLSFRDFYLEVTVETSLCGGLDEYGVLFRQATPNDFYRFSLSCQGEMRLDRLSQGTASSPQPWLASRAVPSIAPATVRLGIWVYGREMRFFIDDEFQFTANDPTMQSGWIGFFARSRGSNAITVNFTNLAVYQISQP